MSTLLKNNNEIEIMREAGRKLAGVLSEIKNATKIGVTTKLLDELAERLIREAGCKPAFLGYAPGGAEKPFPATLCVSVNSTVVHGLPSDYVIQDGDLIGLDLGLVWKGFYSDMAVTVGVGSLTPEKRKLITVTEEALGLGIKAARAGNTLGSIGAAVQVCVEKAGFNVVRTLTGHGIGRSLHEDPYVFNFGRVGEGEKLVPGMVIAIEPMVTAGGYKVKQLKDDSFVTADGSLAAHFEHTVAITDRDPEILTRL